MITSKEQIAIKKTLGNHYTKKVLNELARKKIFNAKGNEFAPADIRKIVTGDWENESLEIAILNLVKRTINKQKKDALKRKNLISNK